MSDQRIFDLLEGITSPFPEWSAPWNIRGGFARGTDGVEMGFVTQSIVDLFWLAEKVTLAVPSVFEKAEPVRDRLADLKARRDALDAEIKLIEDGIRKGAEEACYSEQHIAGNERRLAEGKRQLTAGEYMSGMFMDEESL